MSYVREHSISYNDQQCYDMYSNNKDWAIYDLDKQWLRYVREYNIISDYQAISELMHKDVIASYLGIRMPAAINIVKYNELSSHWILNCPICCIHNHVHLSLYMIYYQSFNTVGSTTYLS